MTSARKITGHDEIRRWAEAPGGRPATLPALAADAAHCTRCSLFRNATGTVFGEGPPDAPVIFVGEQPGDEEDQQGRPFVGPAGRLLDRAFAEAGIDRRRIYITNAVKHFKFKQRGKRRIHERPNADEIRICRWWLAQEQLLIRPKLIVGMGATAARALLQRHQAIEAARGQIFILPDGTSARITVHPSALLRIPGVAERDAAFARFVAELREIAAAVPEISPASAH